MDGNQKQEETDVPGSRVMAQNTVATIDSQAAGASTESSSNESYYWILIAALMLFVLALLLVLRRARKLRQSAYPEILSEITEPYTEPYNANQRQVLD